jgi:tight adherence protein B
MTSVALGLMFGLGLYLLWWSCWIEPPVDNRRERRAGPLTRLTDDIVQAGLSGLGARGLLAGCVAAGLLTFITAWALIAVVPIAVCFAVMVGCSPVIYVRRRARLRRSRLRDLWPDVVDNVTSGIRAGMSLPEALSAVAVRGPAELRPAFAAFSEDYRLTGRFNECLDRLKVSLSDPVADRLIESLRIAREVGGSDLGRLLRTLSRFLRDDARARAEIEARQSWTVNAAKLAAAAPWLVLLLLSTRPESVQAYATPTGALVLLVGALVTALAYWLMLRLGRLAEDERVLR